MLVLAILCTGSLHRSNHPSQYNEYKSIIHDLNKEINHPCKGVATHQSHTSGVMCSCHDPGFLWKSNCGFLTYKNVVLSISTKTVDNTKKTSWVLMFLYISNWGCLTFIIHHFVWKISELNEHLKKECKKGFHIYEGTNEYKNNSSFSAWTLM